ncbi:MAG: PorT family protein [Tannerella sp.]|jgi:hypothetical protein|nr:PorT family protein [Tannerella sp.]
MIQRTAILLCLLLACILPAGSWAQNVFRPEWAVGVSGGVSFASVGFSPKIQEGLLMGYQGGLTLRWITEKNLGLQLELNVKQQGWKENFDANEHPEYADYYFHRRMNYAEIPFFTHIYFGGDHTRFFVNLGPQIGYLFSERTKENLNGAEPQNINAQHTMPADKKIEWGLCGGPGLEIRTGMGYFLLEGRYFYALSDFYNTRQQDVFAKASAQVFSFKITYLMPFY